MCHLTWAINQCHTACCPLTQGRVFHRAQEPAYGDICDVAELEARAMRDLFSRASECASPTPIEVLLNITSFSRPLPLPPTISDATLALLACAQSNAMRSSRAS